MASSLLSLLAASVATASYTSEATALFAAMSSQPDATRKGVIDTLYKALKSGATSGSNLLTGIDVLHIYAAADSQAALLNWKNPATFTGVLGNSPTFTADRGFTTNGSSNYIDTGYIPTTSGQMAQDSSSLSVWSRTSGQTSGAGIGARGSGVGSGNLNFVFLGLRNTSDVLSSINTGSTTSTAATATCTDGSGFFSTVRTGATTLKLYRNGAQIGSTSTQASVGRPDNPIGIGRLTNGGSFTARQFAAAVIGIGRTDAEELDLYNAIQAYMTAVGA